MRTRKKFEGTVVMVAGASRGIGFAIAEGLAKEGATLSIGSRNESAIKEAASVIKEQHGVTSLGCIINTGDHNSIGNWFERTKNELGGVNHLVINTGGPPAISFLEATPEMWAEAHNNLLLGTCNMIREAIEHFPFDKGGSIVHITSSVIFARQPSLLLSSTYRSGACTLIKGLAPELGKRNIRINNLVVGKIETGRLRDVNSVDARRLNIPLDEYESQARSKIPLGRFGKVEEVAAVATFLLSDEASYVTGQDIVVDGGLLSKVI